MACYILTSCTPDNFTVLTTDTVVSPGLAPYVNQSIEIQGYPGVCFEVRLTDNPCTDCSKEPSIIPVGQGELFSLCNYNIVDFFSQNVTSYNITIDGLPYSFPFNPGDTEEDVLNNLNGLALGIFTIGVVGTSPRLYVAGDFVYGNFCYIVCGNPPACTAIQTICAPANCQTQDNQCIYQPIPIQDASGTYGIVINGIAYTSFFPNINDYEPLLVWLNGLVPGAIFTVTVTQSPRQIIIYAYGNFQFGDITLDITNGPSYLVSAVCGTTNPICDCQPVRYFLLTPCNSSLQTLATSPSNNNLYPYEGQTVTFDGYNGACYTISSVFGGTIPPNTPEITAFLECVEPCECEPPTYYNLVDCCTDEPILYDLNNTGDLKTLFIKYTGISINGITPELIGTNIITKFCNEQLGACIEGCLKLLQVSEPQPSGTITIENWEDVIQEITTVNTCKECQNCIECYLLTNCQNPNETIITNKDLSAYINHVISIRGCEDKCWIVTESKECEGAINVQIVSDCPPKQDPLGTLCSYDIGDVNLDTILSYSITINGGVNSFTFNPGDTLETILSNINSINLGQFSIGVVGTDPVYYMAGSETYGPLCYTRCLNPPDCTSVETICIDPVCEEQDKQCTYLPIPVQDASGFYFIVIDSVTYTSPTFPNLNDPGPLLVWLAGLNKGTFTLIFTPLPGRTITVFAYGNHVYGNLTLNITNGPSISLDVTCLPLGATVPDCACCLPPELPPPPVELITRRVKPGYYTKGCPPEYTEKISCKYGDTMFNDVARVRYGIDICCDHDVEKWWIKKELLNLKAIYDPALDSPAKVCYCYIIVQTSGTTEFKYISCEGECTSTTLSANTTSYVCSQTWPNAICPDSGDQYTIERTTVCTDGEYCGPPIIPCYCYLVQSFLEEDSEINVLNCNNQTTKITLKKASGTYFCSKTDVELGRGYVVFKLEGNLCPDNCEEECRCLQLTANGQVVLTYLDCENFIKEIEIPDGFSQTICGKENSIYVTSAGSVLITDVGTCPCE